MMCVFAPLLAAALMAQFQGGTIQGTVVDDQGKPVADAQVVCSGPFALEGKADRVEVQTRTDAAGQFRLASPWARITPRAVRVWAYRPGSAITAAQAALPTL